VDPDRPARREEPRERLDARRKHVEVCADTAALLRPAILVRERSKSASVGRPVEPSLGHVVTIGGVRRVDIDEIDAAAETFRFERPENVEPVAMDEPVSDARVPYDLRREDLLGGPAFLDRYGRVVALAPPPAGPRQPYPIRISALRLTRANVRRSPAGHGFR